MDYEKWSGKTIPNCSKKKASKWFLDQATMIAKKVRDEIVGEQGYMTTEHRPCTRSKKGQ